MITRRNFLNTIVAVPGIMRLANLKNSEKTPVEFRAANNDIAITRSGNTICRIPSVGLSDSRSSDSAKIRHEAAAIEREFIADDWKIVDNARIEQPFHISWTRTWHNLRAENRDADLVMELAANHPSSFVLLPGISCNGNKENAGSGPKGFWKDGKPLEFSAFRGSVPGGTYSEGPDWGIFFYKTGEGATLSCSCSLTPGQETTTHRLLWPERESESLHPKTLLRRTLTVVPGGSFTAEARIVLSAVQVRGKAWHRGLDDVWQKNRHKVSPRYPTAKLWDLAIQFAGQDLWCESSEFTGFVIAREYRDGKWQLAGGNPYEIGWCGQGGAFSIAMLEDYRRNKNQDSLRKGERALDFWAENARLDNGLFLTHYGLKLGLKYWGSHNRRFLDRDEDPSEPFLDTCNLGQGMYYFLHGSEVAKECGLEKPLWRKVGLDACNFIVRHPLPDGSFGKALSLDGQWLATGSTVGAALIPPLLKAYQMTGDHKYLDSASRAFRTYIDRDLNHMHCWGGAVDANCIDKESAWPLLTSALDLYEITKDRRYLSDAEAAAYYLASFQTHYSAPLQEDCPSVKVQYDTFAGTIVSVQGCVQDPWGALIALGWLRLAKLGGNPLWRERAQATWGQATIGVSDGSLKVDGILRPVGSQNEGFLVRFYPRKEVGLYSEPNQWLVAWPGAFRLLTLMHWKEWDVLDANLTV